MPTARSPRPNGSDPDIALLDLHLARGSTGFSVAVKLAELDVPVLFVSGKAPSFPMPDLALGCLMKPFTAEDVHRSLAMAEDMLRGRETLRPKLPHNLTLYEQHDDAISTSRASSRRGRRSRPASNTGSRATSTRPLKPHHARGAARACRACPRSAARRRRARPGARRWMSALRWMSSNAQQLRQHRMVEHLADEARDPAASAPASTAKPA